MPLTLQLPQDLEFELDHEASLQGISMTEYVLQLLKDRDPSELPKTGAELVAYWQARGFFGSRPDILDGPAYARELRRQAETRTRD